jgi:hypothetical protein
MALHHGGLDWVQFAICCQILDGDEFRSVDLAKQQDAGIEGLVMDTSVSHPPERHRAGAAIALRAPLLGAHAALLKSQVIQKRGARVKA